jgi:DNA (cytosine-5)-methyltransferase 1
MGTRGIDMGKVVLSCFDGISCGQVALNKLGIKVDKYMASEVDKYAIQITQANYPDTIKLGDIRNVTVKEHIDILIGGPPCQDVSFAGKGKGLIEGSRSSLFFEFVRVLCEAKDINPDLKFLVENTKMKKEYVDIISEILGVEPVLINSNLFSAQNRARLYWTNFDIPELPEDKDIKLKDILERGHVDREKAHCIDANYFKGGNLKSYFEKHRRQLVFDNPLSTNHRKLTPLECERLQTLPDNYTAHVSNTQRYKGVGNGWTIDVICYIMSELKQKEVINHG